MQKLTTQIAKDGIEKPPGTISSEEQIIVAIAAILFEVDPCLINFGENTGEYIVEAECIANQINDCRSLNQIKTIVDETLIKDFSKNWGFTTEIPRIPSYWLQWLDKYGSLKMTNHAHYTY